MIEQIRGKLIQKSPTFVVVDVAGIGYGVNVSARTGGMLPEEQIQAVIKETREQQTLQESVWKSIREELTS